MTHVGVAANAGIRPARATRHAGLRWRAIAAAALLPQNGRLALWLPVAMASGILLYFLPHSEPHPAWRGAFLAPLALALLLRRRQPFAAWCALLAAMAAAGFALTSWHAARMPPLPDLPRGAATFEGTVVDVAPLPSGVRLTLRGAGWGGPPAERDIRIRLRADDPLRPEPGQRIAVRALVRLPSAPTHPGAWDFQRAAYFSGRGGSGFALGAAQLLEGRDAAPALSATRSAMEARVLAMLPGTTGAIAAALLTGRQSGIPDRDLEAMRDSGLAHLLSVSGLHIAIVMGLVFLLVRPLLSLWPWLALRADTKLLASVAALAAGGFYMVLTGSEVPMQRSFAMAALVTLAVLFGRRAITLRSLAIAAVFVLALNPAAVLGPSFQMSFAAVMALIAAHEAWRARQGRPGGPAPWWRAALLLLGGVVFTSIIAGLATTPIGLAHFGRLQMYGVLANAVAVPLTSFLVMPAGLVAALAMPLGLEGWPLAVMGLGVDAMLLVAYAVAALPGAALTAEPLPGWGLALCGFGMVWLCLWRGWLRSLGVPLIALGVGSAALVTPPDALISADGRVIALRAADGEVLVQRLAGGSRFVAEAWLRGYGEEEARALPTQGEHGDIACRNGVCIMARGPGLAVLRPAPPPPRGRNARAEVAPPPAPPCGEVGVILSPEPVRGRCEGSRVVDRFSVWRDGAHAVWLGAGGAPGGGSRPGQAVVLSDRAHRGDRPWVPPRPAPRYAPEALPLAPTE